MGRKARILFVVTTATAIMAATSCGSSSNGDTAAARGFLRTTAAQGAYPNTTYMNPEGKVVYLPTTPMYMSIVDFPQPLGEKAPLPSGHVHPSGFVYSLTGVTQVDEDNGGHITINPGEAIFAPPFVHHSHENPGPGPDDWLFLGPRTTAVRNQPLPSPSAHVVLNAPELPPLVPEATYIMRLDQITLRPGGQSAVTKQGGPTLVYILDGHMSLHQHSGSPEDLQFGKATFLPEGTVFQLHNPDGKSQSQALVMTMWLQGHPSDTPVSSAPF